MGILIRLYIIFILPFFCKLNFQEIQKNVGAFPSPATAPQVSGILACIPGQSPAGPFPAIKYNYLSLSSLLFKESKSFSAPETFLNFRTPTLAGSSVGGIGP
jgi:hypothetical protein